jgi:hypothetical protein
MRAGQAFDMTGARAATSTEEGCVKSPMGTHHQLGQQSGCSVSNSLYSSSSLGSLAEVLA